MKPGCYMPSADHQPTGEYHHASGRDDVWLWRGALADTSSPARSDEDPPGLATPAQLWPKHT